MEGVVQEKSNECNEKLVEIEHVKTESDKSSIQLMDIIDNLKEDLKKQKQETDSSQAQDSTIVGDLQDKV